ncbi:MAG TPA: hypothetical protein VFW37_10715 [Alphaproteobacteria bacterium]|nr:hypothetical protein [Alphaproteobacteria bacterium]
MQSVLFDQTHMRRRSLRKRLMAAIVGLGLTFPASAYAAPCVAANELAPLQVRMLQTELMVAALTCNQRTDYNLFITRFQPQLSAQGKMLQSFFKQKYGSGSGKALNGFVTRIANESSRRGMVKRGLFCRQSASIHSESKNIGPDGLLALAQTQKFSGLHGIKLCPTKVAAK